MKWRYLTFPIWAPMVLARLFWSYFVAYPWYISQRVFEALTGE